MEKKSECEIVQDLLLGYVDGVLNTESKKLVEKHLIKCENCQKKLEDIKRDIKEDENSQKKEIDYLKKIRRRTRIKAILFAIGIILFIFIIIYLYQLIIVNSIANKAKNSFNSNNFYKETTDVLGNGATAVTKIYYKDGKYKSIWEMYTDEGKEIYSTKYVTANTDESINISEINKKITIEKGKFTKIFNKEENLKGIGILPFDMNNIISKLGVAFVMSIDVDTYQVGKEYYVFNNRFERTKNWEMWIDKETGLPIKIINKEGRKSFYVGTQVVKEVNDNVQEYKYEFGIVTDEDVEVPDLNTLSDYEIEYINDEDTIVNK